MTIVALVQRYLHLGIAVHREHGGDCLFAHIADMRSFLQATMDRGTTTGRPAMIDRDGRSILYFYGTI
jgi:hypothetical protein